MRLYRSVGRRMPGLSGAVLAAMLLASLCAVIAVPAWGGPARQAGNSAERVKITVLVPELANPFWIPAKKGYEAAAKKFNVALTLTGTQQYSAQQYIALMQNAITTGAQGIAVTPGDPTSLNTLINKAVDGGIPVGAVILDAPKSKRQFFVGPDVLLEGREQGKRVLETLKRQGAKGTVEATITSCIPSATGQTLRRRGFTQVVTKQNPYSSQFRVKIVAFLNATGEPAKNFATYQNLITAHPNVKVMYPMCAIDTLSAGRIVKQKGRKDIIVAGHDFLPQTLDLVEEGWIPWTLGENPYDAAYTAVKWLAAAARGGPVPKGNFTSKSVFAVKSNLKLIRKSPNASG